MDSEIDMNELLRREVTFSLRDGSIQTAAFS